MKLLAVGGTFDEGDGRPSNYFGRLMLRLQDELKPADYRFLNGGNFAALQRTIALLQDTDIIVWFADVPNHLPKLVEKIKEAAPKALLVTSKRNDGAKYSHQMLMARALQVKSNLLVELDANDHKTVLARIHDPLANLFLKSTNISEVAEVLSERIQQLLKFTRIPSVKAGDAIEAPDQPEFFELARGYASVFHDLIHASNERFMGNLSFRCECGFPSFRGQSKNGGLIFVSRRNIDKRQIDKTGFVGVVPTLQDAFPWDKSFNDEGEVHYFGDVKPSVDTPIQVELYSDCPKINYMIHSHTYIEGAPKTRSIIPCGALEEAHEVLGLIGEFNPTKFRVNLLGHGSLAAAQDVADLRDIPYIARPMPEKHLL